MSEMVERVARALHERGLDPGGMTEADIMPQARKAARAAIEAMRDPTEAMGNAAYDADLDIYWSYHADERPGGASDVWRVMIDAALK